MTRALRFAFALLCGVTAACASRVDVDKLPAGSEVNVIRRDGGVVHGSLVRADPQDVVLSSAGEDQTIERRDIADVRIVPASLSGTPGEDADLPAAAKFRDVRVPAGTALSVTLEDSVASNASRAEDPVRANLRDAVVIGGLPVLPADSRLSGVVTTAVPSGKVAGRARLAIRFDTLAVPGEDEPYRVDAQVSGIARATKAEDAKKIGIPAVGGAILGGILGGKKGVAIGSAIGGGAGAAVVLSTSGEEIQWPRGTTLTVQLDRSVSVHVPLRRG